MDLAPAQGEGGFLHISNRTQTRTAHNFEGFPQTRRNGIIVIVVIVLFVVFVVVIVIIVVVQGDPKQ